MSVLLVAMALVILATLANAALVRLLPVAVVVLIAWAAHKMATCRTSPEI